MGNSNEEVRIVNPVTGGMKGSKLARYDLIPTVPLKHVAEVYGRGAKKYTTEKEKGDRNWEKGYDWSLSYAALQRHANAFWSGEEMDPDGFPHLAAVCFHAMALMEYCNTHRENDDRPTTLEARKRLPVDPVGPVAATSEKPGHFFPEE